MAGVPFASATEAWLWAARVLQGRRDGSRPGPATDQRPCLPDDIVVALDRLYLERRITVAHGRVLRHWGDVGCVPDVRCVKDVGLWRDAMLALDPLLRRKGIVN